MWAHSECCSYFRVENERIHWSMKFANHHVNDSDISIETESVDLFGSHTISCRRRRHHHRFIDSTLLGMWNRKWIDSIWFNSILNWIAFKWRKKKSIQIHTLSSSSKAKDETKISYAFFFSVASSHWK